MLRRFASATPSKPWTVIGFGLSSLYCLLFCLVAPAWAQEGSDYQWSDQVTVDLVNVEVWVTDKKGQSVTGLLADDFEVFEDGEPVEVTHFAEYRVDDGLQTLKLEDLAAPEPEPADLTPEERAAAQGAEGYLVLFFDEVHMGPVGRERLIKDLKSFLKSRQVPYENILLLRRSTFLYLGAPLGSSRKDLLSALDDLKDTSNEGVQNWADERQSIRRVQDLWEEQTLALSGASAGNPNGGGANLSDPCTFFAPSAFREVQFYVQNATERIRDTLSDLRETASFLAGLPGPKTLLYVADGLTMTPGSAQMSFVRAMCPSENVSPRLDLQDGLTEEFRAMTRHAAANRITFYTLQSVGLRSASTLTGADQRTLANTTARAMAQFDSDARILQREGLSLLASETGGRAIFNRGRFDDELEKVAEDMKGHYSLAYVPRHGGDGLEHRIKVKLSDRKLNVRHRPGYRDKNAQERMAERLDGTLYLNLMANPLELRLGVGTIQPVTKSKHKVPLYIRFPADKLTFLPTAKGEQARLMVQIKAQDERRRVTAALNKSFTLDRPPKGQDVSVQLELELIEGIHVVAVGARDEATLETSYVSTGMQIRNPAEAAAAGASP